ncbi:hypothetical protein ACQZV8_02150 [Magnetococcales bacterium HHB-1]
MTDSAIIDVQKTAQEDHFKVTVREKGSATEHQVHVPPPLHQRLAKGHTAEHLLNASFLFLLQREPKEMILGRFSLPVISRYFPEYEQEIARYL